MAHMFKILLLLAYIFHKECICALSNNKDLLAVVQIFRHGQRIPYSFYPNDRYASPRYWNGAEAAELTNEGKRQLYALGIFTRKRYQGWLPIKYNKKDFYAQTTNIERTHMSALASIYGLYPAIYDQIWNPLTDWQPIPVHVVNPEVLAPFPDTSCVGYYSAKANYLSSEESLVVDKQYSYVYEYINNKIGTNITSYTQIHNTFDSLHLEHQVGLRLPEWSTMVFPEPLNYLTAHFFHSASSTRKLQRLIVGTFLYEIMNYLDSMAENRQSRQKFHMYSAHDYTLSSVLNAFQAYDLPPYIEFASSMYIELRRKEKEHYINIWFRNQPENMEKIVIKGCDFDCPLKIAKELLSDVVIDVDKRKAECRTMVPFVNDMSQKLFQKMTTKVIVWRP